MDTTNIRYNKLPIGGYYWDKLTGKKVKAEDVPKKGVGIKVLQRPGYSERARKYK